MSNEHPFMDDVPDFVYEAEAATDPNEFQTVIPEVTLKCSKKLVSDTFVSKAGDELVEIRIPNQDPADSRSWESFIMPANQVHDNKFGKGVWMKLPEEGRTRLGRSVRAGQDDMGRTIWKREYRWVSNMDLKGIVEYYKTQNHDSIRDKLDEKKEEAAEKAADPPPARAWQQSVER